MANILSLMCDGKQWIAAVQCDSGLQEMRFPLPEYDKRAVILAIYGKKPEKSAIAKQKEPTEQELEQKRAYTAPVEEVPHDESRKNAATMTRKGLLQALNKAGLKGYQTMSLSQLQKVYNKAVADGKIK